MISLLVLLAAMTGMLILWVRVVGINLSLSSVMMGGLLTLHGPAYLYYTRAWGPGESFMRDIYSRIHSVPVQIDESGRYSVPVQIHESGLATAIPEESINFFDHILTFAQGRAVISELDLALGLLFVSFCGGLMLADRLLGNAPAQMRQRIDAWEQAPVRPASLQSLPWIVTALAMGAAVALTMALQEDQIGRVVQYFQSNAGEFEKIAMRRALGGSAHYLYNLTLAAVLPLLTIWALVLVPQAPRLIAPVALFLVAVVLLGKLASLSKAPPAFFCLQLVALTVIWRKLSLTAMQLLVLGSVAILLLVGVSFVANVHLRNPFDALIFLFYRIFMIPNESLVEYFSAIPSVIEHTAGRESRWLAALLHTDPLPATYSRVADVFRNPKGASTTNAMFLADAWAAFSWKGVGMIGIIAGVGLRTIDTVLIARLGKSAATVAALTAGLFGVFVALSTAFQTALLTGGLLLLVPFALMAARMEANPQT